MRDVFKWSFIPPIWARIKDWCRGVYQDQVMGWSAKVYGEDVSIQAVDNGGIAVMTSLLSYDWRAKTTCVLLSFSDKVCSVCVCVWQVWLTRMLYLFFVGSLTSSLSLSHSSFPPSKDCIPTLASTAKWKGRYTIQELLNGVQDDCGPWLGGAMEGSYARQLVFL